MTSMSPPLKQPILKQAIYILAGLAVLALLALGLHQFMDHRLRQTVAEFAAQLQPNFKLSYSGIETSPFAGQITLTDAALGYGERTVLRAKTLQMQSVQSSSGWLTNAQVTASELQISPYLSDVPVNAEKNVVVTGDATFLFAFDNTTNSYSLTDLNFASTAQHLSATAKTLALNNLVLATDGKPQNFALNAQEVVLTSGDPANTNPPPHTQAFSLALQYAQSPDKLVTEIKDFQLTLPELQDQIRVASAKLQTSDAGMIPQGMQLALTGLDFPVVAEQTSGAFWQAFGYQRLKGDVKFAYAYQPDGQLIETQTVLALPEMFNANLRLQIGGVDLATLAQQPSSIAAVQNAQITGGELMYADASLLKRMIETYAKQSKMEPVAYVTALGGVIDQTFIPDPAKADPALVDASGKLKAYLQTLGTLTVNFRPGQPVPLGQVVVGIFLDRIKLWQMLGTTLPSRLQTQSR